MGVADEELDWMLAHAKCAQEHETLTLVVRRLLARAGELFVLKQDAAATEARRLADEFGEKLSDCDRRLDRHIALSKAAADRSCSSRKVRDDG